MTRKYMRALRSHSQNDLQKRVRESRSELAKLRAVGAKGTLKKESGRLRPIRRNIARMETVLSEIALEAYAKQVNEKTGGKK